MGGGAVGDRLAAGALRGGRDQTHSTLGHCCVVCEGDINEGGRSLCWRVAMAGSLTIRLERDTSPSTTPHFTLCYNEN